MKKEGVLSIKQPELEIELSPQSLFQKKLTRKSKSSEEGGKINKDPNPLANLTPWDVLFHSVPGSQLEEVNQ